VRFGADPKRSALDLNCKAHDLDNLYVVDASFFPSSSAVNPGLTTIANALRVGDHLLQRLDAPKLAGSVTNGRSARADTQTLQPHATDLTASTG
jgi:choline dehydrogenase-like flavoprotein